MPLNLGYKESTAEDELGRVVFRVYYDATQPVGPNQTLINGPRGWCLDITNTRGRNARCRIRLPGDPVNGGTVFNVGQGDPVTSGPATGRSRTAAQLAQLGFTTRGQVEFEGPDLL